MGCGYCLLWGIVKLPFWQLVAPVVDYVNSDACCNPFGVYEGALLRVADTVG